MFRVIRGKYAKIVLETHAVFVYCVNARRAACGKGRGRGCVLFAFASAAPDPFLVEPKHLPVSTAPAQGLNTAQNADRGGSRCAAASAALPAASAYPGILNLIIRPAVGRAARPARAPQGRRCVTVALTRCFRGQSLRRTEDGRLVLIRL